MVLLVFITVWSALSSLEMVSMFAVDFFALVIVMVTFVSISAFAIIKVFDTPSLLQWSRVVWASVCASSGPFSSPFSTSLSATSPAGNLSFFMVSIFMVFVVMVFVVMMSIIVVFIIVVIYYVVFTMVYFVVIFIPKSAKRY